MRNLRDLWQGKELKDPNIGVWDAGKFLYLTQECCHSRIALKQTGMRRNMKSKRSTRTRQQASRDEGKAGQYYRHKD